MDDLLNELEPQGPAPEERERRRRLIAAVGIAGLSLLTVGTLSSGAWFSDTETVAGGQIVTGSVILTGQPAPATKAFAVTNMAPGDTEYGQVQVSNTGSLQLRYALTANTSAVAVPAPPTAKTPPSGYNLADQLEFTVCDKAFDASGNCTGNILFGPAHWGDGITATTVPSTSTVPGDTVVVFGSPTDQPGTRTADRVIPAGGSDTLYIKAYLDGPSTGNEWQATGTAISLVFNSFQTANNTP
jgi:hypothetical protein